MPPADRVLVVMAKHPTPGAVKTRLAARFGDEAARGLYCAFLRDIAHRFSGIGPRLVWAVHPPGADIRPLVGGRAAVVPQEGADLGARMRHVFAALFAEGAARVVMIGADVPHLAQASLDGAFDALEDFDVTLVPSADGGYCAVGLRADSDVFAGVSMSTPSVLTETLRRIDALGLSAHLLPTTFDVDEPEDVFALDDLIRCGAVDLPFTRAVLRAMLR